MNTQEAIQPTDGLLDELGQLDPKSVSDLSNTLTLNTQIPTRLYRMPTVQQLTGFSRTEIYKRMKEGTFPQSIKLGKRSIAWSSTTIEAFIHGLAKDAAK